MAAPSEFRMNTASLVAVLMKESSPKDRKIALPVIAALAPAIQW